MDSSMLLKKLLLICTTLNYIQHDIVFKSCSREWIVILKKLPFTQTNEGRRNAINVKCAKFRGNIFQVVDILNKFDAEKRIKSVQNSIYDKRVIYTVGEIIEIKDYDHCIDNICSRGIHYYKSIKPAFYMELTEHLICNGKLITWGDDGQKILKVCYKNEKPDGEMKSWVNNVMILKCHYKDGQLDGTYERWSNNNKKVMACYYTKGVLNGVTTEWAINGKKLKECSYVNGIPYGHYTEWNHNGIMISRWHYNNNDI
jgi:signal peptidase I